jgi:hypothetical protein
LGVSKRLCDERLGLFIARFKRSLGELERHDRLQQALLCAVMQVSYDAASCFICFREETRSGGHKLVTAVGVRDRGGDELGERVDLRLNFNPGVGSVPTSARR